MENFKVIQIANSQYTAVIDYSKKYHAHRDPIKEGFEPRVLTVDSKHEIYPWGMNNDLPQKRELLLRDNNIIMPLIERKRDVVLGNGIYFYREIYEEGKRRKVVLDPAEVPANMLDFFEDLDMDDYFVDAADELALHNNVFTEFVEKKNGQVNSLRLLICRDVRAKVKDKSGVIPGYMHSLEWTYRNTEIKGTPIAAWKKNASLPKKYIYHAGDPLLDDGYYFIPIYWGGRDWITLANMIPKFHIANLQNGYTIRFHIEVPEDYFNDFSSTDKEAWDPAKKSAAMEERKLAFEDDIRMFLSGPDAAGSTLFSVLKLDDMGRPIGVKINSIKSELNDEALIKLFEKSNQANISAQSIHPTLANIETAGKLSSGSEMRSAYNVYVHTTAPKYRRILSKPLQIVAQKNKWDRSIKWDWENFELTKLDDNPSGSKSSVEE